MIEDRAERDELNRQVIDEFRANGGTVGRYFEGKTLLLLHHTGAKSGTAYTSPLTAFAQADGSWVIVASNAGRDNHPSWYVNLQSDPEVTIEIPDEDGGIATLAVKARITAHAEREALFSYVKEQWPGFGDYENATVRQIPVVVLEPGRRSPRPE